MKNLFQCTTVLFLLVQTIGYSQTKDVETISKSPETAVTKQEMKTEIDTEKFISFIGNYLLEEGDFTLEIVQEKNTMYIVSPFSKDILVQKNETTLREPTRGVDLERIGNNINELKFTQNGYETIIKRVNPKTDK